MINRSLSLPALCLALVTWCTPAGAANWPAWRGHANGSGVAPAQKLPDRWSATENVRWKIALPDRGNSTPIVWGDKVFLTQAVEKEHSRSLVCYSRQDGRRLWQQSVTYANAEDTHDTNPYCSASPVTDGDRIIACHGSAGVFCYDLNGKELWRRDLGRQEYEWGSGSSPVLHGDLCFLYFGPGKGARLVALNTRTGVPAWTYTEPAVEVRGRTDGFRGREPGMICTYSTPIIVPAGQREELIMSFPRFLRAFDPKTGRELWSCDGLNPLVYTSPIHADGIVVAMGGFQGNSIAVRTGGDGDVTASHRLWRLERAKGGIGTGVIHDGHVFHLGSGGIAECLELKTGKVVWSERVKGPGPTGDSWSSMVLAGDRIYILNQSGDCIVLRASPHFERIGAHAVGNELTNASLAVSDGELFIRTHKHLWCISPAKITAQR